MDLETFLENFEATAEAPGGIPKLRSLILDLAVWGKLVPQNQEYEPAFTEEKSVIEIDIQELHELPKNWILSTVNNACSHIVDCPHSTAKFVNEGFYCIDTNSIIQGQILFEKARYVTEETFVQRTKRLLPEEGDILFSREGTIGISAIVPRDVKLCLGQRMMMYRVHRFLDSFYFLYFLTSPFFKKQLELKITGTAAKHVNIADIRKMVVIVPPLAEQKRIVEKVDELMRLCDRYEAAKQTRDNLRQKLRESAIASLMNAETDEELEQGWAIVRDNWCELSQCPEDVYSLRQTVLQLAVQGKLTVQNHTDQSASLLVSQIKEKKNYLTKSKQYKKPDDIPFEIPYNWVWLRIDDFYDVSGGIQKTPKRTPVSNYFPYLRVANVQRGYLDLGEIEYFELLEGELERWNLQSGDLLIVEGNGSSKEIGRCAIWNGEIEKCVHQNHIIRVRPISHEGQLFTLIFLNSPSGMTEMRNLAITTSGLYSLSVGKIREILVPLPPPAEQKRIVAKVDELMKLCDQLEASLRQSQQRAESLAASAISHLTI